MGLTTDPADPRLGRGVDEQPGSQNAAYLVLSSAERAKGFVRPVRGVYVHVGIAAPKHPLRDLTDEEHERYGQNGYVKYEAYPADEPTMSSVVGRFWTQPALDSVGKGCGAVTTMGRTLAETYARNPGFYSATYCAGCQMHRPVGADGEFIWNGTDERIGT